MVERLIDHHPLGAGGTPQVVAIAVTLADCHTKIFEHREAAKKLVDLECAREPAARAIRLAQSSDILAVKQHTAGVRFERTGNQVDERRLAGSVGSDQRTTRAAFEYKIDVA